MVSLRTQGADDLDKIAARLREAGDRKLKNNVAASIRKAAKPMGSDILREAAEDMPQRGGFAARLAGRKFGVRSSLTGRSASVWLAFKPGGKGLAAIDKGDLRHPVYGHRKTWVSQRVPAGRLSAALQKQAPKMQRAVLDAANKTLDDVARGL